MIKRLEDRFDKWISRQSADVVFLVAVSPLLLIGFVALFSALIWGGEG